MTTVIIIGVIAFIGLAVDYLVIRGAAKQGGEKDGEREGDHHTGADR